VLSIFNKRHVDCIKITSAVIVTWLAFLHRGIDEIRGFHYIEVSIISVAYVDVE